MFVEITSYFNIMWKNISKFFSIALCVCVCVCVCVSGIEMPFSGNVQVFKHLK